MAGTNAVLSRAVSQDGTAIGFWTSGQGLPLVLLHGTAGDHTRWAPLLPYLEPYARVHAVDRRGRGASGDGTSYDLALEFADVAAVVDAVAERSGSPVDVYGHSYGATCALGGAALTGKVRRLVLYEPPLEPPDLPAGLPDELDALLGRGQPEAVVVTFMSRMLGLTDLQVQDVVALSSWPGRLASAPTIPRELRAAPDLATAVAPGSAARVGAPTLLLLGGDSPEWVRLDTERALAALPDARVSVLEGQRHLADVEAPELVAERLRAFLVPVG